MTFWKFYYHLVWSTKNKRPFITLEIERNLYPFLVHRAAEMEVFVYAINGWRDHVHLVTAVPPKLAIAQVSKDLKGASSHFVNSRGWLDDHFQWQRGYGALSMGEKQRPFAEAYVRNQKQHHEQQTTNSWLERMTDEPIETTRTLRESGLAYELDNEFPF